LCCLGCDLSACQVTTMIMTGHQSLRYDSFFLTRERIELV
jgi:hypothetical protein